MSEKKTSLIAVATATLISGGIYAVAWKIADSVLRGKRFTYEEAVLWQKDHSDINFFADLRKEDYTVTCGDGYILHAMMCRVPSSESDKCVIMTHGHGDNRYGQLKYMKIYLDLGFNCIIYDLRGHGKNAPADCTYGILEGRDLISVLADARARFPEIKHFAFHGESLGSATTLTALGENPEIDFAVADCGFSDLENVLDGIAEGMHIPKKEVQLASAIAKKKCGYSFSEMRPIDHLKDNTVPILFIHGGSDTFITPENSERMHMETKGYSELRIVPGAKHAESVFVDPVGYKESLRAFVEKVNQGTMR